MQALSRPRPRRMRVVSASRVVDYQGKSINRTSSTTEHHLSCDVGDIIYLQVLGAYDQASALNLRTNEEGLVALAQLEELSASVLSEVSAFDKSKFDGFIHEAPVSCVMAQGLQRSVHESYGLEDSEIAFAGYAKEKSEPHLALDTQRYFLYDYTKLIYQAPRYAPPNPSFRTRDYKLALLGDTNTGKTSLFLRWRNDQFTEAAEATIGSDFFVKHFCEGDFNVRLVIFDTAGQEVYKALTTHTLRDADFICFVFSYDDLDSFAALPMWLAVAYAANPHFIGVLIGNKFDLYSQVTYDQVEALIHTAGFRYFFSVSCSVGFGVHRVLYQLVYDDVSWKAQAQICMNSNVFEREGTTGKAREDKSKGCC